MAWIIWKKGGDAEQKPLSGAINFPIFGEESFFHLRVISLFFGKYANIILEIVRTIFQVLIIFPKGEIYFPLRENFSDLSCIFAILF